MIWTVAHRVGSPNMIVTYKGCVTGRPIRPDVRELTPVRESVPATSIVNIRCQGEVVVRVGNASST